jgi:hypothetical protein
VVIRNYEGYIAAYEQSSSYVPHDHSTCEYCSHKRLEPGQGGLAELLDEDETSLNPDGHGHPHEHGGSLLTK